MTVSLTRIHTHCLTHTHRNLQRSHTGMILFIVLISFLQLREIPADSGHPFIADE